MVYHDMEGLSGQSDPRTFEFGKTEYAEGQRMLVGDVNAVIAGLFDGGADEVHVVDGHGSGNPDPDLLVVQLDPRAVLTVREEPFDAYTDLPGAGTYDAVAVVGMHAKTGSGGFASHTYTLGIDIVFNGRSITETELVAFSWGRYGVPVIFASGDDRLAADLETMPWIEFVTVKTATSAATADLRPVDEARGELRAKARRAVSNLAGARVMKLTTPMTATLHAVAPARLTQLEGVPGLHYADDRVTFEAAGFAEAYAGIEALIGVASRGYVSVLVEIVREQPNGEAILETFGDRLTERWLDVESGRWTASARSADRVDGPLTHFGFR